MTSCGDHGAIDATREGHDRRAEHCDVLHQVFGELSGRRGCHSLRDSAVRISDLMASTRTAVICVALPSPTARSSHSTLPEGGEGREHGSESDSTCAELLWRFVRSQHLGWRRRCYSRPLCRMNRSASSSAAFARLAALPSCSIPVHRLRKMNPGCWFSFK